MHEIKIPKSLQHLNEIRIGHWFFEEGDSVDHDSEVVEITTEEGGFKLIAPVTGVLEEVYFHNGESVLPTDILGIVINPADDRDFGIPDAGDDVEDEEDLQDEDDSNDENESDDN